MMVTSILFALLGPCLVFVVVLYYDTISSLYVWCSHIDSTTAVHRAIFYFFTIRKIQNTVPPSETLAPYHVDGEEGLESTVA